MARFMQKPYVKHLNVVKQILRYVVGTKDLTLKYSKVPLIILLGFSDFDYGGDKNDRNQSLHMCSTFVQVLSLGLPRSNLL